VATGYSEGLPKYSGHAYDVPLYLVVAAMLGVVCWRRLRSLQLGARATIATVVLGLVWLFFGLKLGFVRVEDPRIASAYAVLTPLALWAAPAVTSLAWRAAGLAALVLLVVVPLHTLAVSPIGVLERAAGWVHNLALIASSSTFADEAAHAASTARASYGLTPGQLGELRTGTQVDPWETTAVWAYGLPWAPVPAFQTYVAYTASLDDLNADALRLRAAAQPVLIDVSRPQFLQDANELWTSPGYQFVLTCQYAPSSTSRRWEVWRRTTTLCAPSGEPVEHAVTAGESVPLRPQPGELLTVQFAPSPGLLSRAESALLKPPAPLLVTLGPHTYRLPRPLAVNPLIVSCPPVAASSARYAAVCPGPGSISFSDPGVVTVSRWTITTGGATGG
jgi:hypothetical protein